MFPVANIQSSTVLPEIAQLQPVEKNARESENDWTYELRNWRKIHKLIRVRGRAWDPLNKPIENNGQQEDYNAIDYGDTISYSSTEESPWKTQTENYMRQESVGGRILAFRWTQYAIIQWPEHHWKKEAEKRKLKMAKPSRNI